MRMTLKSALTAIWLSTALLSAVPQSNITPPKEPLSKGCVYLYEPQILDALNPPREFTHFQKELLTKQATRPWLKETAVSDKVKLPWKWGVACGMHGFDNGENSK